MDALSNNLRGYYLMYYAKCPYRAGGAQGNDRLGLQDRTNGWWRKYTCFHRLNVVSCEIVWKVSDVEAGLGVSTVVCGVYGGVGSEVGSDDE